MQVGSHVRYYDVPGVLICENPLIMRRSDFNCYVPLLYSSFLKLDSGIATSVELSARQLQVVERVKVYLHERRKRAHHVINLFFSSPRVQTKIALIRARLHEKKIQKLVCARMGRNPILNSFLLRKIFIRRLSSILSNPGSED